MSKRVFLLVSIIALSACAHMQDLINNARRTESNPSHWDQNFTIYTRTDVVHSTLTAKQMEAKIKQSLPKITTRFRKDFSAKTDYWGYIPFKCYRSTYVEKGMYKTTKLRNKTYQCHGYSSVAQTKVEHLTYDHNCNSSTVFVMAGITPACNGVEHKKDEPFRDIVMSFSIYQSKDWPDWPEGVVPPKTGSAVVTVFSVPAGYIEDTETFMRDIIKN